MQKVEWRFHSPSDISIVGRTKGGKLICKASDHLLAVDISNGLPVWRTQLDLAHDDEGRGPSISVVSDIITLGDRAGKFHLLQGETGSHFGMMETSSPFPRLLSKGTSYYYVVSSNTLICYNPTSKAIEWMFEPIDKHEIRDRTSGKQDWVTEEGLPQFFHERPKPSSKNPERVDWIEYDKIEEFEGSRLVLTYIEWSMHWWYEADDSLSRANVPLAQFTVLEATTGSRITNLDAYAWPGETSKWQRPEDNYIVFPEYSGKMICLNVVTGGRRWSYTHQWRKLKYDGLCGHEFATTTQVHDGKVLCVFDGQEIVVLNGKNGILEQVFRPPGVGEILCFQNGSNSILLNYGPESTVFASLTECCFIPIRMTLDKPPLKLSEFDSYSMVY